MNFEAAFAEIRGDVKRIFDFLQRDAADKQLINDRLNAHSTRITVLEGVERERVGMAKMVKLQYTLIGGGFGSVIVAILAFVLRAKGV